MIKKLLLKNESGESIIAVIVAVVVLAGVFMAIMPPLVNIVSSRDNKTEPSQICRGVAQNILSTLRSSGAQSQAYSTPIGSTSVFLSDGSWHQGRYKFNPQTIKTEIGASPRMGGTRWPNEKVINWDGSGSKYKANTPLLIESSVNALLSVYNDSRRSGVCTNEKGIALENFHGLAKAVKLNRYDRYDVRATVRVRPYDLNSGDKLKCHKPLYLRPYAESEPPEAVRVKIIDLSKYKVDKGLKVKVFVNVKPKRQVAEKRNEQIECTVAGEFQFDRMDVDMNSPEVDFNGNTMTVSGSADPDDFNPGSHLVCRSTHYNMTNRNSEATRAARGINGGGSSGVSFGKWVTCDKVQACGKNPRSLNIDYENNQVTNTYPPFPPDCFYKIEAGTFDVVGNLSNISTKTYYNGEETSTSPYRLRLRGEDLDDDEKAYEVGGVKFRSIDAAKYASSVSNIPVNEIRRHHHMRTQDRAMSKVAKALGLVTESRDGCTGNADAAANSLATVQQSGVSENEEVQAINQSDEASWEATNLAELARKRYEKVKKTVDKSHLGSVGTAAVEEAYAAWQEAIKQAARAASLAAQTRDAASSSAVGRAGGGR